MMGTPRALGLTVTMAVLAAPVADTAAEQTTTGAPPTPPPNASANAWGGVGLINTRSARFRPDGTLEGGTIQGWPSDRYVLSLTALPWLEVTARYSISDRTALDYDRSFDMKIRLQEETATLPAVAIGLQDFLGTGIFTGEYVTFSKRAGALDFSGGVGWGRFAERSVMGNPLELLYSGFGTRTETVSTGGTPGVGQWFQGPDIGIFGGVEWFLPVDGLSLKAEYSSDMAYRERLAGYHIATSPYNFGLNYQPNDWLDMGLAWERGENLVYRASIKLDTKRVGSVIMREPPPAVQARPRDAAPPPADGPAGDTPRPALAASEQVAMADADALFRRLETQGLEIRELTLADRMLVVTTSQSPLRLAPDRLVRAAEDAWTLSQGTIDRVGFRDVASAACCDLIIGVGPDSGPLPQPVTPVVWDGTAAPDGMAALRQPIATQLSFGGGRLADLRLENDVIIVETLPDPGYLPAELLVLVAETLRDAVGADLESVTFRSAGTTAGGIDIVVVPQPSAAGAQLADVPPPAVPPERVTEIAVDIFNALGRQHMEAAGFNMKGREATLYIKDSKLRQEARIIGRAAKVVANHAPPQVERITIVTLSNGLERTRASVWRSDIEGLGRGQTTVDQIARRISFHDTTGDIPAGTVLINDAFATSNWWISPELRQFFMDPDSPYRYSFALEAGLQYMPVRGYAVTAAMQVDLFGNMDDIKAAPGSALPHVRTDVAQYLSATSVPLLALQFDRLAMVAPNVYGRLSAGYFERMYAGYGGEILWQKPDTDWALGLEAYKVWKRDFDGRLGLQDYSVATGHGTVYWNLPWYDLHARVSAGRYLAGDVGGTLLMSRRFDSGVEVGGWATLTNVPFDVFGEGSFDKGIFLSIPLDLFTPFPTRAIGSLPINALTRDGGQRLAVQNPLYDMIRHGGEHGTKQTFETFDQ